jgi:hypothetical protein
MRKKSKYRPKGVRLDNMTWVMSSIKPFDSVAVAVDLRIKNHAAIEALRLGQATRHDMDVLIGAFNMCEGYMRLRDEFGVDWAKEIREGQDALLAVSRRGLALSPERFICRADELVAINMTMQIHDAQLDQSTVQDMERALAIVEKDERHGKARAIRVKEPNETNQQNPVGGS